MQPRTKFLRSGKYKISQIIKQTVAIFDLYADDRSSMDFCMDTSSDEGKK